MHELLKAAKNGDLATVKNQIDQELVSVNYIERTSDYTCKTALHYAAEEGHLEIVYYLLTKGANIHSTTQDDNTPQQLAERNNRYEVAELLRTSKNWQTLLQRYPQINFHRLIAGLETSFFNIETTATNKDLVMFIGNTGAGKSTTINFLLGHDMQRDARGRAVLHASVVGKPHARIGHVLGDSETIYATVYSSDNYNYCDCPGFGDTRGPEMEMLTELNMELVTQFGKSIRALAVVIDYYSLKADKADSLKNLCRTLGRILKDPSNPSWAYSTLFIITKTDGKQTKELILNDIKDMLDSKTKALQKELLQLNYVLDSKSVLDLDESIKEKIDEMHSELAILNMMYQNPEKLILIDVFDKVIDSRNEISSVLTKCQSTSLKRLNFSNRSTSRIKFNDIVYTVASDLLAKRKQLINLPEKIKQYESYINSNKERIQYYKSEIQKLSQKNISDEILEIEAKSLQIRNTGIIQKLDKIAIEIKEVKTALDQLIEQKKSIDVKDPIIYWQETFQQERSLVADIADNVVEIISTPLPAAIDAFAPPFVKLVMSFIHSAKPAIQGGLQKLLAPKKTFHYEGQPFCKYEKTCDIGQFVSEKYEPTEGKFDAVYRGHYNQTSNASISIYMEKRFIPAHKEFIRNLDLLINEKENILREYKKMEDSLFTEQTHIKELLTELDKGHLNLSKLKDLDDHILRLVPYNLLLEQEVTKFKIMQQNLSLELHINKNIIATLKKLFMLLQDDSALAKEIMHEDQYSSTNQLVLPSKVNSTLFFSSSAITQTTVPGVSASSASNINKQVLPIISSLAKSSDVSLDSATTSEYLVESEINSSDDVVSRKHP
jgi:GTP-binding protein EngB required for normal cell division